ncbi:MAG: glycosyl transferase group 2 family protein [Chlamydiia bacterium]|nr:glycosyl transferase group 2 family protein [Chlamydiia bacterium]
MILYSIVVPIFNECDNITPLTAEIETVMNSLNSSWELIFVDDGSLDNSHTILRELAAIKPYLRPLHFKKNAGQTAALDAGFKAARGSIIITLDGDGQNNPNDIPRLLDEFSKGYDLITGKRISRQDSRKKRLISKIANFIRQKALQDGCSDTGCSLKVYRKSALDTICLYKGMHRFLPALFLIEGYKVKEVEVDHRLRKRGVSKYNFFNRGISLLSDLLAVAWMRKRKLNYEINHD